MAAGPLTPPPNPLASLLDAVRQRLTPQAPPPAAPLAPGVQDARATAIQNQWSPAWHLGNAALTNGIQALLGATGLPLGDAASKGNQFGQLVNAAIPFAGATPLNRLFHGMPSPFEGEVFDIGRNQTADILGPFINAAEDPRQANYFSERFGHNHPSGLGARPGSNVVPVVPSAKNALDLTTPLPQEDWQALIRNSKDIPGGRAELARLQALQHQLPNMGATTEGPGGMPTLVHRGLANFLTRHPEVVGRGGFDAVRYYDWAGPSEFRQLPAWAIPASTPTYTPWGTPLTPPALTTPMPPQAAVDPEAWKAVLANYLKPADVPAGVSGPDDEWWQHLHGTAGGFEPMSFESDLAKMKAADQEAKSWQALAFKPQQQEWTLEHPETGEQHNVFSSPTAAALYQFLHPEFAQHKIARWP